MIYRLCKPLILTGAAFILTAVAPIAFAQDHPEEHHSQNTEEHHDDHGAMQRDDHHDNDSDAGARYRHDHPHASARCHDGFFTNTRDRGRACSKHGGIDVWLSL